MKISKLLATRQTLLRQTQLANLAYAYTTLKKFAHRIAVGDLSGTVKLRPANPADDCFWATLTALEGNQSVIEEHFGDQEIIDLAEALAFTGEGDFDELEFKLEELEVRYVQPLRNLLEQSGIVIDEIREESNIAPDLSDLKD